MSYRVFDGYSAPQTANGIDGYTLSIRAQGALGTNSHGGQLILSSGPGVLADGYLRLQTGGHDFIFLDGYNVDFFASAPPSTPPNGIHVISVLNRLSAPTTAPIGGGILYSENGDGYWMSSSGLVQSLSNTRIIRTFPSDADYTAVQSDYQAKIMEFTGSISTTRNVVVPLISGYQWTIFNNTTGGQSIQIIGLSGTGITIANGKRAIVYADSTNIVRVTPDT